MVYAIISLAGTDNSAIFTCKLGGQKPTHLGKSPTHSKNFAQMV